MSKHTPGPWFVDEEQGSGLVYSKCEEDCPVIVTLPRTCHSTKWHDARLIAAAPKLLEALKEIAAGRLDHEHGFDDFHDRARSIARAAIAKAECKP